jgi:very-short-patch-repair endonuclease
MEISKQEYIVRSFAKLRHKKWELYVITRVFHLLNDLNVEFVCQQPILSVSNERHLVDMYFPQFNICLEIDEKYHSNEAQQRKDKEREQKILEKRVEEIGLEGSNKIRIMRINIAKTQNAELNISAINSQIESFVYKLKKEKSQIKNLHWDFESKFSPTQFIEKGYLRVEDRPWFRSQKTALKCFGFNGEGWQRAVWPRHPNELGFQVWFVRLTKHKDWQNLLSDDGLVLTETLIKKCQIEEQKQLENNRDTKKCVFVRKKDDLARTLYRFIGMFEKIDGPKRTSDNCLQWRYKRISSSVKLPTEL